MKTAESIEANNEQKKKPKYGRGQNPNSHTATGNRAADQEHLVLYQWKPGQSGNPNGRPKDDVAKEIARAIFENNREALYKAYGKAALKGNAYAFKELADRAYGKLKERVEYDLAPYTEASEQTINERIRELESKLGVSPARTLELPGGTSTTPECAAEKTPETQD